MALLTLLEHPMLKFSLQMTLSHQMQAFPGACMYGKSVPSSTQKERDNSQIDHRSEICAKDWSRQYPLSEEIECIKYMASTRNRCINIAGRPIIDGIPNTYALRKLIQGNLRSVVSGVHFLGSPALADRLQSPSHAGAAMRRCSVQAGQTGSRGQKNGRRHQAA